MTQPSVKQPKTVTIRIDGTDQRDIEYWTNLFYKGAQRKGDNTGPIYGILGKFSEFMIYPRAVND